MWTRPSGGRLRRTWRPCSTRSAIVSSSAASSAVFLCAVMRPQSPQSRARIVLDAVRHQGLSTRIDEMTELVVDSTRATSQAAMIVSPGAARIVSDLRRSADGKRETSHENRLRRQRPEHRGSRIHHDTIGRRRHQSWPRGMDDQRRRPRLRRRRTRQGNRQAATEAALQGRRRLSPRPAEQGR